MTTRPLLLALTLAAALALAAATTDARAATTAATVRVAEGYYPATGSSSYAYASEPCPVAVGKPGRVSAHDVLAAARSVRCVSSYEVDRSSGSAYLRCVEGRCEDLGFYWAIYRNGALTCEGLDDILVSDDDEIVFSYEPYPTALALAGCEVPA